MSRHSIVHTRTGIEMVRRLSAEGARIFTTERAREMAPAVGLSEGYLGQALHHLTKAGWIIRLRKGLYALAASVPGATPVHEFEVAMALVSPAAISHWSALHHHGLTDQVPTNVFVLTTSEVSVPRLRRDKVTPATRGYPVRGILYQFIQVKPERYFGTEKAWIEDARVTVTNPERTLLDGLAMPQFCGDFAEVLRAFQVRGNKLDVKRIIEYALRLDAAAAKRLGWVLEKEGVDAVHLQPLSEISIKGYRKLDPISPSKGPYNRRWMIQENLPGKVRG